MNYLKKILLQLSITLGVLFLAIPAFGAGKISDPKYPDSRISLSSQLHFAIKDGDLEKVKYLIEVKHCDIETPCAFRFGWTPLRQAIEERKFEIVGYLLKRGANIDLISKIKSHVLSTVDSPEMTHCLLQNGVNPNKMTPDDKGVSALAASIYHQHSHTKIQLLLQYGAHINAQVFIAAITNRLSRSATIFDKLCRLLEPDNFDVKFCNEWKNTEIVLHYLLIHGAEITPKMIAMVKEDPNFKKILQICHDSQTRTEDSIKPHACATIFAKTGILVNGKTVVDITKMQDFDTKPTKNIFAQINNRQFGRKPRIKHEALCWPRSKEEEKEENFEELCEC